MSIRNIEKIISPPTSHFVGDGFKVHNFIPGNKGLSMQRMSPFILLDYNAKFYFPPSEYPRGVGVHPHRGFETVTISYKGKVAHHDSSGGGGVISEGDVQWMTAASGVLHKEYHEKEWSRKGGDFQMVQLWVNLPAAFKMSSPKYQAINNNQIPRYQISQNGGYVEVIAGEYNTVKGAATTFTPLNLLNVHMHKSAELLFDFPSNFNTAILVIEGRITINENHLVPENHFAVMNNDGNAFKISSDDHAVFLVLSGEPIQEPIAHYGPFVMNTQAEINQALQDFNMGLFGHLED